VTDLGNLQSRVKKYQWDWEKTTQKRNPACKQAGLGLVYDK
jgi:hypothetical protein